MRPLDLDGLLATADEDSISAQAPARTDIGHINLHVANLAEAERFFRDFLGLEVTAHIDRSATFLATGGYHHHVAVNTWGGKMHPSENSVGLISYRLAVPNSEILADLEDRACLFGYETRTAAADVLHVRDPNGLWLGLELAHEDAVVLFAFMNFVALKMFVGDRAKYIGIIIGLTFASLLITQQSAIFVGLMTRTFSFLTDVAAGHLGGGRKVQFIDDIKPLQDTQVLRVRGVEGVEWAVPMYKGLLKARLDNGTFQTCVVIGLDDETLIGGPPNGAGQLADLRRSDGVIVDVVGAPRQTREISAERQAHAVEGRRHAGAERSPRRGGWHLPDHADVSVAIRSSTRPTRGRRRLRRRSASCCRSSRRKRNRARTWKRSARSRTRTGLKAYTRDEFKKLTFIYFLKYTGMPINFLTAVALGFFVGITIAGQTFYNFTLDNLRYFGTLKAMGTTNGRLLRMILLQALLGGRHRLRAGCGAASAWGWCAGSHTQTRLSAPLATPGSGRGVAVLLICLSSAALSIRKVMRLEPAVVFRS